MNKDGVNVVDVYDKLYNEILFYVKNKNVDVNGIEFNVVNFNEIHIKENFLNESFLIVDHIEEDKMEQFIKCKKYNHKENSVLSFNVPIYLQENLKSYNYDSYNVWDQFEKDCPRTSIYVNDQLIHNEDMLRHALVKIQPYIIYTNGKMYNMVTIIAMICNQSSYAFPYIFLNQVQHNVNSDIVAVDCSDNRSIRINVNDNNLKIWIDTDVNFRSMTTNELTMKTHITLLIESLNIKTDELENMFNKCGMFFINFY